MSLHHSRICKDLYPLVHKDIDDLCKKLFIGYSHYKNSTMYDIYWDKDIMAYARGDMSYSCTFVSYFGLEGTSNELLDVIGQL